MFVPDMYRAPAPAAIVRRHPFAQLVTSGADGMPFATALPLYFETDESETHLIGHLARRNPHATSMRTGQQVLAVFQGPHAYISPSWYVEKPEVPTWDYLAAQIRGTLEMIDDDARQLAILARTIELQEAGSARPWRMELAPEGRVMVLLPKIRSFRIAIERIDGVTKLNQMHPPGDRRRIAEQLERSGRTDAIELAQYMRALPDA